jgi:hypothetical protein
MVYLDWESHACVPKRTPWLALTVAAAVLLWITVIGAGAPLLKTIILVFMEIVGTGKLALGRLLARLLS